MIIEYYELKCFALGAFVAWNIAKIKYRKVKTFEIREFQSTRK